MLCPCGGRLRVIAFITEPRVITRILEHLKDKANLDATTDEPNFAPPPTRAFGRSSYPFEAPRIAFVEPNTLRVEESNNEAIRSELEAMGHELEVGGVGNAHGVSIDYGAEGTPVRFEGGTVLRGTGAAKGY